MSPALMRPTRRTRMGLDQPGPRPEPLEKRQDETIRPRDRWNRHSGDGGRDAVARGRLERSDHRLPTIRRHLCAAGLRSERMRGRGVAGDVRIDWPELIAFKRTFTDPIPQKREHDYAERGIDTFHGHARFTDRNTMGVDGTALEGRHFLIAAGAEPIKLGIPGAEYLVTHEDFLAVESLPPRIVLVGGGYIAAEFAHIAARAGAPQRNTRRVMPV